MNAVVGFVEAVNEPPVPVITLQEPVPTVGVFAAKVAVAPQIVWSGPALATLGLAVKVTTTSSVEGAQGEFAIVQRKVYTFPRVPMNAELGLLAEVIDPPVPEMMVHVPIPEVGVFAAKTAVFPQTVWSEPAFAIVGVPVNVITTSSVDAVHGALAMVQRRV